MNKEPSEVELARLIHEELADISPSGLEMIKGLIDNLAHKEEWRGHMAIVMTMASIVRTVELQAGVLATWNDRLKALEDKLNN